MKRELNEDEKKLISRSLLNLNENLRNAEGNLKIINFKLDHELEFNYNVDRHNFVRVQKQFTSQIESLKKEMTILEDQFKNGVEIKVEEKDNQTDTEVKE